MASSPILKLKPHSGQIQILNSRHRNLFVRAGRRWGKTKLGMIRMVMWSLNPMDMIRRMGWIVEEWETGHKPVNLVTAPTAVQARQIWFEPMSAILENHPLLAAPPNKTSMTFKFKGDRPDLLIRGANDSDGDRLRGLKILAYHGDEIQDYRRTVIDRVISPALADLPFSQALYTGTPKGKYNILYDLEQRGISFPDRQQNFYFPTSSNPHFPKAELEYYQRLVDSGQMSIRAYNEEFIATYEDIAGQWFTQLSEANLVHDHPESWDTAILGIDHGDCNPAHVVIVRNNGIWYYVDGYQPSGVDPVPEYIQDQNLLHLAQRWNVNYCYADPSRPARIIAIRDLGHPGLKRCVAGYNKFLDGTYQMHNMFATQKLKICCGQSHEADRLDGRTFYDILKSYHKKEGKDGKPVEEEAIGQNTHPIDALRYSIAAKNPLTDGRHRC